MDGWDGDQMTLRKSVVNSSTLNPYCLMSETSKMSIYASIQVAVLVNGVFIFQI